jgi:hypothetical protein
VPENLDDDTFLNHSVWKEFAADLNRWSQKKRPALPQIREELLSYAQELRSSDYEHTDGTPITPEERKEIRAAQRALYRDMRVLLLDGERQIEAQFWAFFNDIGLRLEGGIQ